MSPIRPPDIAEAVEDEEFDVFIENYVDIKPVETDISEDELRDLFNKIDKDGGGTLDAEELKSVFSLLGHPLSLDEVQHLIAQVDEGKADDGNDDSAGSGWG